MHACCGPTASMWSVRDKALRVDFFSFFFLSSCISFTLTPFTLIGSWRGWSQFFSWTKTLTQGSTCGGYHTWHRGCYVLNKARRRIEKLLVVSVEWALAPDRLPHQLLFLVLTPHRLRGYDDDIIRCWILIQSVPLQRWLKHSWRKWASTNEVDQHMGPSWCQERCQG